MGGSSVDELHGSRLNTERAGHGGDRDCES